MDPDLFFPERGYTGAKAKAVCCGCPITKACLDYSLEHHENYGIWGGLSPPERKVLRGQYARPEVRQRMAALAALSAKKRVS
jgi:hypothetical protein